MTGKLPFKEITMTADTTEKYRSLLSDFNVAMLVTISNDGKPQARPMVIAAKYDDDEFGFVCSKNTATVNELRDNARVCMTLQGKNEFMSIAGKAIITEDRGELERLWQPGWQAWFPKGKNDPDLVLLRLKAETAEYWDLTGINQLRFLYQAGKAMVSNASDADKAPLHDKFTLGQ